MGGTVIENSKCGAYMIAVALSCALYEAQVIGRSPIHPATIGFVNFSLRVVARWTMALCTIGAWDCVQFSRSESGGNWRDNKLLDKHTETHQTTPLLGLRCRPTQLPKRSRRRNQIFDHYRNCRRSPRTLEQPHTSKCSLFTHANATECWAIVRTVRFILSELTSDKRKGVSFRRHIGHWETTAVSRARNISPRIQCRLHTSKTKYDQLPFGRKEETLPQTGRLATTNYSLVVCLRGSHASGNLTCSP